MESKRSLTRLLTKYPEIIALDSKSHMAILALSLELVYKGKAVAKIGVAWNAPGLFFCPKTCYTFCRLTAKKT